MLRPTVRPGSQQPLGNRSGVVMASELRNRAAESSRRPTPPASSSAADADFQMAPPTAKASSGRPSSGSWKGSWDSWGSKETAWNNEWGKSRGRGRSSYADSWNDGKGGGGGKGSKRPSGWPRPSSDSGGGGGWRPASGSNYVRPTTSVLPPGAITGASPASSSSSPVPRAVIDQRRVVITPTTSGPSPSPPQQSAAVMQGTQPTASGPSCRGTLKMYNARRAFGFICPVLSTPDPQLDAAVSEGLWFFGVSHLGQKSESENVVGEEVLFDIRVGETGKPQAIHVVLATADQAVIDAIISKAKPKENEAAAEPPKPLKTKSLATGVEAVADLHVYGLVVSGLPASYDADQLLDRFQEFGSVDGACVLPAVGIAAIGEPCYGCAVLADPAGKEAVARMGSVSLKKDSTEHINLLRFDEASRALQLLLAEALNVDLPDLPPLPAKPEEGEDAEEPHEAATAAAPGARLVGTLLAAAGLPEGFGTIACEKYQDTRVVYTLSAAPEGLAEGSLVSFEVDEGASPVDGLDGEVVRAVQVQVAASEEMEAHMADAAEAAEADALANTVEGEDVDGEDDDEDDNEEGEAAIEAQEGTAGGEAAQTTAEPTLSKEQRKELLWVKVFPCKKVLKGQTCEKGAGCPDAHSLAEIRPLPDCKEVRKVARSLMPGLGVMPGAPSLPGFPPPGAAPGMFGMLPGMVPMAGPMGWPMGMPGFPSMPGMPLPGAMPGARRKKDKDGKDRKEKDRERDRDRREKAGSAHADRDHDAREGAKRQRRR